MEEIPEKLILKTSEPLTKQKIPSKLSINNALNKKEEKIEELFIEKNNEDLPNNHFTETDLKTEWAIFINQIKDNFALKTLKVSKENEDEICINYPSNTAKDEFKIMQNDFLNHFQHKVKNFKIKLIYKEDQKLVIKQQTKKEKFAEFAGINPILKDLDDLMKFDFN